jgi:hypothetical protein
MNMARRRSGFTDTDENALSRESLYSSECKKKRKFEHRTREAHGKIDPSCII